LGLAPQVISSWAAVSGPDAVDGEQVRTGLGHQGLEVQAEYCANYLAQRYSPSPEDQEKDFGSMMVRSSLGEGHVPVASRRR
jgi:hypothetical protein